MKKHKLKGIAPSLHPPGMECHWEDGLKKTISYKTLRDHCPCAPCKADRPQKIPKEGYEIKGVNWVGNYALGILWADNHSTGIYPFSQLREWCKKT